jgi:hypothetical protein
MSTRAAPGPVSTRQRQLDQVDLAERPLTRPHRRILRRARTGCARDGGSRRRRHRRPREHSRSVVSNNSDGVGVATKTFYRSVYQKLVDTYRSLTKWSVRRKGARPQMPAMVPVYFQLSKWLYGYFQNPAFNRVYHDASATNYISSPN